MEKVPSHIAGRNGANFFLAVALFLTMFGFVYNAFGMSFIGIIFLVVYFVVRNRNIREHKASEISRKP